MKHVGFAHGMVMDTTNYTVMCWSKMESKARKIQGRERKGEKHVAHVEKKLLKLSFCCSHRCILKFGDVFSCRKANIESQGERSRHQGHTFVH